MERWPGAVHRRGALDVYDIARARVTRTTCCLLALLALAATAAGPAGAATRRITHWPNSPVRHPIGQHAASVQSANNLPTFSANLRGGVVAAGNTLLTCPANAAAKGGAEPCVNENNNDNNMGYVNVAPGEGHFDSSRARFAIPANARVLRAYLYWGADLAQGVGATNTAKDAAPGGAKPETNKLWKTADMRLGTGAFANVDATSANREGAWAGIPSWYSQPGKNPGFAYQVRANVTADVAAYVEGLAQNSSGEKQGTATIADVQAGKGYNRHGGWNLLIVWESPTAAFRDIALFDGFEFVQVEGGQELVVGPLDFKGFETPSSGKVDAHVTTWTYEGDRAIEGDYLALGNVSQTCKGLKHQSDALHKEDNFFNSTISTGGVDLGGREPDYKNQMGFDLATLDVPEGTIPNGATGASVCLGTDGDTYFFGGIAFDTLIRAPNVQISKVADRAQATPGETVNYTTTVTNPERKPGDPLYPTPTDPATNMTVSDPLPSGLDFKEFTVNPESRCSYSPATRTISCAVGTVNPGGSFSYSFAATVDAVAQGPAAGTLTNTGCYRSNSADQPDVDFTGCDEAKVIVPPTPPVPPSVDLGIVKAVSASIVEPGHPLTWTLVATNHGPGTATGVVIADQLPEDIAFTSLSAPAGVSCTPPPVGAGGAVTCTTPSMAAGASLTISIVGQVSATAPNGKLLVNVATVAGDQAEPLPDPNPNRDSTISRVLVPGKPIPAPEPESGVAAEGPLEVPVSAVKAPPPPGLLDARLALKKQPASAHAVAGSTMQYRLRVRNLTEVSAVDVRVCDTLPRGLAPASVRGFTVNGSQVCTTLSHIAPVSARTLSFTVQVAEAARGTLRNTATASAHNARRVHASALLLVIPPPPHGLG